MLFRIDIERFLTHAIDHFTCDELSHFEYAIIGTIKNGGRCKNIAKINGLFPDSDIQSTFIKYNDKTILKKMYTEQLDELGHMIYHVFINTILSHKDIVILCRQQENDYIDILVDYLKKKYSIDCIDLNELFTKGRVGSVYIDRDKIHDKAVNIRRSACSEQVKALESTHEGRLKLLGMMSTKDKMKKLKGLGINVSKSDIKDLDKLLIESWVEENDE